MGRCFVHTTAKTCFVFSMPAGHAEQGVSTNPPEQDPGVPPGQAAALPQRKTCSIHFGQQTVGIGRKSWKRGFLPENQRTSWRSSGRKTVSLITFCN